MNNAQKFYNDAQAIVELAKAEERDLTPDEDTQIENLMKEGESAVKREALVAELEKRQAAMAESRGRVFQPEEVADLPKDEKRGYSMLRAISRLANGQSVDGLEGEISQEIATKRGKDTAGFFMPMDTRANELDSTQGTGAVPAVTSSSMIEMLRNQSVVMKAGATTLPNLEGSGSYVIPKQTGAGTAVWISENADGTPQHQTIGSVTLAPNTLSVMTEISRRFLLTSNVDAEAFVKADLAAVSALALDYACIYGDGSTIPITGVLQNSNTNLITAGDDTNGARLLLQDLYNFEKEIAVDNATFDGAAWVTGPKLRSVMKATDVAYVDGTGDEATGQFMWKADDTMIGYPCFATNQVPETISKNSVTTHSGLILGAFSQMLIGIWGSQEILVDPYSLSKSGGVRIVSLLDVDMELRHPTAFCRCVDARNA